MLKTIIGLEIHVQLNTKSKMFCGCDNNAESKEPNTVVCPVCMGYPGTLPVANIEAVKKTIKTGLALNCSIPDESKFDRKHYFYPDLPKNFQISQYDQPFCKNGKLKITKSPNHQITIRINRVHLEEDAGKLIHPKNAGYSLVDMNRCGTPLMEVVTEPDIDSPELAKIFLKELRLIIRYLGVSDADMEKGHLRCDANISVRDEKESSPIVEIKNMNSFRAVEGALSFEEKRLKEDFDELKKEKGKQTRSWDDEKGETRAMRRKEEASDYRYFPEPDVPPIKVGQGKNEINLDEIKKGLPKILPSEIREKLLNIGVSSHNAEIMVEYPNMDFAYENEQIMNKELANWYVEEVLIQIKEKGIDYKEYKKRVPVIQVITLLDLVKKGEISNKIAREIFSEMVETGKSSDDIITEKGIKQVSDEGELKRLIEKVIKDNPGPVADYKKGKTAALGFLVGQVMKETKGQANPALTNKLLTEMLR